MQCSYVTGDGFEFASVSKDKRALVESLRAEARITGNPTTLWLFSGGWRTDPWKHLLSDLLRVTNVYSSCTSATPHSLAEISGVNELKSINAIPIIREGNPKFARSFQGYFYA